MSTGTRSLRLLVVNQRMDRTGGPSQLATLMRGLREAVPAEIVFLRGSDGPLRHDIRDQVDRLTGEPWWCRALGRAERAAPAQLARRLERLWCRLMRRHIGKVDVVYVNSLISRRLARPFHSMPMLVHVHELRGVADSYGSQARALVRAADLVLVPSHAALQWVHEVGVPTARVVVVPGCVAEEAHQPPSAAAVDELRQQLGVENGQQVVAAVGWLGELKGTDRFLDVARCLGERGLGDLVLLWVGDGTERQRASFDAAIHEPGLVGRVRRVGHLDDLRPLYALADVILITSREESLSLVALEATARARPVVCFPGAGGPDELADEGIVQCAPSAEPAAVAAFVDDLLSDAHRRAKHAAAAATALDRHHSTALSRALLAAAVRRVSSPD